MEGMGRFVPHWHHALDMGVPRLVGLEAIYLYDVLRRHACFDRRGQSDLQLSALFREGLIVCSFSHAELAARLGSDEGGVSVRHVVRQMNRLREIGWVKNLRPRSHASSVLIYHLGYCINTDRKLDMDGEKQFFADEWLRRAYEHVLDRVIAETGNVAASLRDIPFPARVLFLRDWMKKHASKEDAA